MRENIFALITAERARQDHKWGAPQENTFSEWAGILAEECGEASAELNELNFGRGNKERAVKELVEAAAVAVAIIEQYEVAQMVTAAWYAYRTKPEGGAKK